MPEQPAATGATPDPGATPEAVTPPADQAGQQDPAESDLGDAGKRALEDMRLQLKRITRERDELQKAQQEREDAERSDLEKVTRERDELQGRIGELEHEGRARTAATEAGVPDLWDRLKGTTAEELAEDAKAMAERLGQRPAQSPDLGAGARQPAPAGGHAGMNERIRRAARR
jgi:hypothetical protein